MTGRRELVEALAEVRDMPDGAAKIAELERIAAHADAAGDVRVGFDARIELVDAYDSYRGSWRALPTIGWCLTAYDRHPSAFRSADAAMLRRRQKAAIAGACRTPRVGLAQTVATLDDMERRLRADGYGQQPTYALRCRLADCLGDQAAARDWLARWRAAPQDENSDCADCDAVRQAGLLAGWGDWAGAVRIAEPLSAGPGTPRSEVPGRSAGPVRVAEPLSAGQGAPLSAMPGAASAPGGPAAAGGPSGPGCPEQPERALAALMVPYLQVGRLADAAAAHVRAYRRHRHERDAFPVLSEHLRFCALTGDHERGLRILAEHLARLDRPYDEMSAMEFAAAGALVCRVAGTAGIGGRTVRRPAYEDRPAADLTVATLGAELAAIAEDLAGRFDARNGTGHQSGRIAGWLGLRPLCAPLALPPDEPDEPGDGAHPGNEPAGANPGDGPGGVPGNEPAGADPGDGRESVPGNEPGHPSGEEPRSRAVAGAPVPLSVEAIAAVLGERGDRYVVGEDDTVAGRWDGAVITFQRIGERREILHARVVAERRLGPDRLAEAYEFCNAWNHDRLLPKAYVHPTDEGELVLAGEVTTDLEHGVTDAQLAVLVNATLATGVAFAGAVAALS